MTVDERGLELPSMDPTGFFGQENFVHKRLIRGALGFAAGGPAGAVAGLLTGGGGRRRPPTPPPGRPISLLPEVRVDGNRAVVSFGGPAAALMNGGAVASAQIGCSSGYHPNRSDYFLMSGEFVAKGSRCVRNRRRNPMNPRALSRSIARIDGAKGLQGKLAEISTKKWTAAGKRKEHH